VQRNPQAIYDALIANGDYKPDQVQADVVTQLEYIWQELKALNQPGLLTKLGIKKTKTVTGLYMWGGVGRGKTWLMDLFYDSLPGNKKKRIHFHHFMAKVHQDLAARPDERDPLPAIAKAWANECRVLCFDEFFVSDIADAMLLSGLLQAMFDEGVTLVATSNVAPDDLYRNGLQRAKFLPAIEALKAHTKSIHVDGDRDFRLRHLQRSKIYLHPLDKHAEQSLQEAYQRLSGQTKQFRALRVNGRKITAKHCNDGVIWFGFDALCEQARSTADYIKIAHEFNTVILSDVPPLDESNADAARRFINLIDEFYDRNVKMLISAAKPIDELYSGKRLAFEFRRTASRLTEMQSLDYLAKPHLP
jgi:cell division protein ZapE